MTEERVLAPALYEHCMQVYEQMSEESNLEDIDGTGESTWLVYEGFLTNLFKELGLSVPYYSSVMGKLKAMASVQQLRRGGSTTPSRWQLLSVPTLEGFRATPDKNLVSAGSWRHGIEQQIRDLNERLVKAGL